MRKGGLQKGEKNHLQKYDLKKVGKKALKESEKSLREDTEGGVHF